MRCSLSATGVGLGRRPFTIIVFALALLAGTVGLASAQALSNDTGPNLGTYSSGQVQIPLSASGGTGSYTWSVLGGDPLPAGIIIRTGQPSWVPSNASAGLIAVGATPRTYAFTLRVSDGSATADRLVTVRISG